MSLHHWSSLWRQKCEWRRWASSHHCISGRRQSSLPHEQTIYHLDPNSSEVHQSLPVIRKRNTAWRWLSLQEDTFLVSSRTLHADTISPPAHIIVLLMVEPHQSLRLHTLCSTTGSRACWSLSGIGPWAETEDRCAQLQRNFACLWTKWTSRMFFKRATKPCFNLQ